MTKTDNILLMDAFRASLEDSFYRKLGICPFSKNIKNMSEEIVNFNSVENRIITVRNTPVIIDSDVAKLYGVETKRINEAAKNNPDKFPNGYILDLTSDEWRIMKSKISTSLSPGGKVKLPKAFTEKGLLCLQLS